MTTATTSAEFFPLVLVTLLIGAISAGYLARRNTEKTKRPSDQIDKPKPQQPLPKTSLAFNPPTMSDAGPTNPPGNRVFSVTELAQYDGSDECKPVYLAIKGIVFDVTKNRSMYVPGQGYSIFAGKDASRALGKSSLKVEDCVSDYSGLSAEEMETLNKWEQFYRKKYDVVGKLEQ